MSNLRSGEESTYFSYAHAYRDINMIPHINKKLTEIFFYLGNVSYIGHLNYIIMDLFGIKRRKAEKEARKLHEKKLENAKFEKVKEEYKSLKSKAEKMSKIENDSDQEWTDRLNNKCPKCGSTKVNDRIKRIQGEFSGEGEGSLSGFGILGTGYVSGSYKSSSHGKIDTNEVNKCECGHEWKKAKSKWISPSKFMEENFKNLQRRMERYQKALEAEINPKDLDEEYKSNEEKREALILEATDGYIKGRVQSFFGDTSIESIMSIAELEIWKDYWDRRNLENFKESFNAEFLEIMGLKHMELNV